MNEEQLSEAEKRLFQRLEREKAPPKDLEQKIVKQLIDNGEIKKTIVMNTYLKWAASVAAAVLFFMGGSFYGGMNTEEQIVIEPTRGYMLILHEDENFNPGDPMEMFEEYRDWMQNTFASGIKITGQELGNDASLVTTASINYLGEEAQTRTTGYFVLEANSLEDAIAVAKANPHVKYGGTVEVKTFLVRQ